MTYKLLNKRKGKTGKNGKNGKKGKQFNTISKSHFKSKKSRTRKMKGGFSGIFTLWDTMTYNLSNALSTFTINPPTAQGNAPDLINPSISKQFLQVQN